MKNAYANAFWACTKIAPQYTVLFCGREWLIPAKSLAQDPERCRDGDEEQAKTDWAAPAEPRTPRAPVLKTVFVTVAVVLFDLLETFL
jgi:hypothetical protein